jgi:hypothetical protein
MREDRGVDADLDVVADRRVSANDHAGRQFTVAADVGVVADVDLREQDGAASNARRPFDATVDRYERLDADIGANLGLEDRHRGIGEEVAMLRRTADLCPRMD